MLSGTRALAGATGLAFRRCWLILVFLAMCSIQAHAFSGAWTRKADVPTHRVGAAASVIGDSIYVLGGYGVGLVDVATNEVYNASTDSWEGKEPLPTRRSWPASVVVDGLVYCIGGGYPIFGNVVEAYDPATNTWTTEAAMPTARFGATASVVNGVIYVIGGYPYLRTCEAYDPSTNSWTTKAERPESGGVFAATVYDGIIYTFGGGSVESYVPYSTVYAYNPQTGTWAKKADMPTARFGLQTYLVDGKIYAIGGTNQLNIALATVEVYDPASDTWAAKSDMPGRFMFFAGAVVGGKIYVIGGTPDMVTGGFEVWEYDPEGPESDVGPDRPMPAGFVLHQNYPNPFNPGTTISYALPHMSHVTLTVFNTLGQQVASLVEGEIEAGYHEVTFDATGHASGVYLYRLQITPPGSALLDSRGGSAQFVQMRRMILVH